jgi:CheY-like chemotaxis protein
MGLLPTGTSSGAIALLARALAKEPSDRFADGAELVDAIGQLDSPSVSGTTSGPLSPPRPGRWSRSAAVLATATLLTVLAARWVFPFRAADLEGIRVLWVDDNPENNAAVVERLAERGAAVTAALSTDDAVSRYPTGSYDLVVSDMGRYEGPEGAYVARAGFDLLERLRTLQGDVRVVFCTSAQAFETHGAEALASGAAIVEECEEIVEIAASVAAGG